MSNQWQDVSRKNPCPSCGKPDWCRRTLDGEAIRCMRSLDTPAGYERVKTNPDGGVIFEVRKNRQAQSASRMSPEKSKRRTYPTTEAIIETLARRLKGTLAGNHLYHNPDRSDSFRVLRFDLADGDKQYRPIHPVDGGWQIGDPPGPLPLYRRNEIPPCNTVYIVEGEKAVDALIALGLAATTSSHGCKAAAKSDWTPMAGREVVILPDADEPGMKYAKFVRDILQKLGATVKIVNLPLVPDSGDDIYDLIEERRIDGKDDRAIVRELEDIAALVEPCEVSPISGEPVIVNLAGVEPEQVEWLWPGRFPLGKLSMLSGDPGLGKSFLTLDMAAHVSRGKPWPDDLSGANPVGGVVLLSAEDDVADTIVPRLMAMGADLSRINVLKAVKSVDPETGSRDEPLNLGTDLYAIEQTIKQTPGCRLVVVDPITAYCGKTDSHNNADVRGLLAPLAAMAARMGIAFLAVNHLNKKQGESAIHRSMGSVAFTAAARASWLVAKDENDPARRLMVQVKSNLAQHSPGLAFTIAGNQEGNPVVIWESEPVEITADDALNPKQKGGQPKRDEAADFLRAILQDGPVESKMVYAEAERIGIKKDTLRDALKDIGGESRKSSMNGPWFMSLPLADSEDRHSTPPKRVLTLSSYNDTDLRDSGEDNHTLEERHRKREGRKIGTVSPHRDEGDSEVVR